MRNYLFALVVVGASSNAFAQSGDFAISGAKVFVGDGHVLQNATVVVKGGKIESVSTNPAPPNITIIDGKGKVLYPGFIDAYSTRLTKTPSDTRPTDGKPDTNTSAPPFMWIGNRKGIYSDFSVADNLDFEKDNNSYDAGITTAFLAPSRGSIRGACSLINLLPANDPNRFLKKSAGFGLSYRNGSGDGYPSNILGVVALMRQVLADAKSLSEGVELSTSKDKPFWMKSLEDLKPLVTGQQPGVIEVNLDREIDRSIKLGDEFGFQVMLAGGRDAYKMSSLLVSRKIPVLLSVDNLVEPSVEPDKATVPAADVVPVEIKKERHDRWEEQMGCASVLAKSGVQFAFSSGGSPSLYLENIRKLLNFGIDKDTALKAMTINAAEIMGVKDQVGSIEAGKQANLVLMSDEFTNASSKVNYVWITGKVVLEPKKEGGK